MYNNTGLIGHPLSHTLSPLIHNYCYFNSGINGGYCCFDIPKEDLSWLISIFKKYSFKGFNVTLPYKSEIISLMDHLSEEVEQIGASNTVKIQDDKLYGYNTDIKGILATFNLFNVTLRDKKILVLGSGGSARPLFYMLKNAGARSVDVVNRTVKNTENILNELKIQKFNIYDTLFLKQRNMYDIIVNTTSLGLNSEDFFEMSNVGCSEFAFDLQYSVHGDTPFLSKYRGRCKCISDGLVMLISQGVEAFNIFHNMSFSWDVFDIRNKLIRQSGLEVN